ncbi:MAG: hypothetical protein JWQ35_293 [Bacteriovoracaceae bacterium]|nr:hypothetical protein [Bacteriovoracaceae bacterium]
MGFKKVGLSFCHFIFFASVVILPCRVNAMPIGGFCQELLFKITKGIRASKGSYELLGNSTDQAFLNKIVLVRRVFDYRSDDYVGAVSDTPDKFLYGILVELTKDRISLRTPTGEIEKLSLYDAWEKNNDLRYYAFNLRFRAKAATANSAFYKSAKKMSAQIDFSENPGTALGNFNRLKELGHGKQGRITIKSERLIDGYRSTLKQEGWIFFNPEAKSITIAQATAPEKRLKIKLLEQKSELLLEIF